jgi:hypothetical protein
MNCSVIDPHGVVDRVLARVGAVAHEPPKTVANKRDKQATAQKKTTKKKGTK